MSMQSAGARFRAALNEETPLQVMGAITAYAGLMAKRTGDDRYWQWYERIWAYSWEHFVDHQYGAWFRILDADNRKYSDEKSPAGKVDYHTMGACYEVLNVVR